MPSEVREQKELSHETTLNIVLKKLTIPEQQAFYNIVLRLKDNRKEIRVASQDRLWFSKVKMLFKSDGQIDAAYFVPLLQRAEEFQKLVTIHIDTKPPSLVIEPIPIFAMTPPPKIENYVRESLFSIDGSYQISEGVRFINTPANAVEVSLPNDLHKYHVVSDPENGIAKFVDVGPYDSITYDIKSDEIKMTTNLPNNNVFGENVNKVIKNSGTPEEVALFWKIQNQFRMLLEELEKKKQVQKI